MVEDLPCRPAPEVDVEIAEVLAVRASAPFTRRHPVCQRRRFLQLLGFTLDPATTPFGFLLVGRVPDHHRDRLFPLDLVRVLPRLGNRREDSWNPSFIVVGIPKCIGYEHSSGCRWWRPREINDLREYSQLGN